MEYIEPIFQNPLLLTLIIAVFWVAREWWIRREISISYTNYTIYAEDPERSKGRFSVLSLMLSGVAFLDIILDQIRREEYSHMGISVLIYLGVVGVTLSQQPSRADHKYGV